MPVVTEGERKTVLGRGPRLFDGSAWMDSCWRKGGWRAVHYSWSKSHRVGALLPRNKCKDSQQQEGDGRTDEQTVMVRQPAPACLTPASTMLYPNVISHILQYQDFSLSYLFALNPQHNLLIRSPNMGKLRCPVPHSIRADRASHGIIQREERRGKRG